MGTTPSCVDCRETVPKTVRFFDNVPWCNGRTVYKYFTSKTWIKLHDEKYLCPDCLTKRQKNERKEEEEKEREQQKRQERACIAEQLRIEKARHEEEERRRKEEEERRRKEEEERRRKEEEERRRKEEEERQRKEEEERRHKEEEERQRKEEEERRRDNLDTWIRQRKHKSERKEVLRIKPDYKMVEKFSASDEIVHAITEETRVKLPKYKSMVEHRHPPCSYMTENNTSSAILFIQNESMPGADEIRLPHLYYIISQDIRNKTMENITMDRLSILSQKMLSEILKQFSLQKHIEKHVHELKYKVKQSFDKEPHITVFALMCIFKEYNENTHDDQTLEVFSQYIYRQHNYANNELTLFNLLRKVCDALSVLCSNIPQRSETIGHVLNDFFEHLVNLSIHAAEIDTSFTAVQKELGWKTADLLLLLCYMYHNRDKGNHLVDIILDHRLNADMELDDKQMVLKDLLVASFKGDPVSKLKAACKAERSKNVEDLIEEMKFCDEGQNSDDFNKISKTIENIWKHVSVKIASYGYPGNLARKGWKYEKPLVNLKVFDVLETEIASDEIVIGNCIAEIFLGVKIVKDYWPRSTQFVALSLLILSIRKGKLLEVNTGEGKSCIVAMFAVFLAMSKKYVDIVSSSPILAERDSMQWHEFYKIFCLSSGTNLTQTDSSERLACYKDKIVYGTVSSFASDILRHEFLMEDTRGARLFDAVIVDEVDCLLLDNGVNSTYLSHASPGMHHIEPILLMIWNEIIRTQNIETDEGLRFVVGKPELIHAFLAKLLPDKPDSKDQQNSIDILLMLEKACILQEGFTAELQSECQLMNNSDKPIGNKMHTLDKSTIIKCLQYVDSNSEYSFDYKFECFEISHSKTVRKVKMAENETSKGIIHLLVMEKGYVCALYEDKEDLFELIREKIEKIFSGDPETQPEYQIPSYLIDFIKDRLSNWIENAFIAKNVMIHGRHYVMNGNDIIPVDFESTGVVESDTKWGDGLHQFLEIKHDKKLSPMTIVTNFLSNQGYFKRYPLKIFGVSGTLGTQSEKSHLTRMYQLSSWKIPTHNRKKFREKTGIICSCKDEWLTRIKQIVNNLVQRSRTVLIVCEDINAAKEVSESLNTIKTHSVHQYTSNEQEEVVRRTFAGGDIIVATNIAGRGTDIDIDKKVVGAGGLFVLVTFLPMNSRVEQQVFGRSARKGHPGSAQIVINRESLPLDLKLFDEIRSLKHIRDDIEEQRIKDVEGTLLLETKQKEELFEIYCKFVKEECVTHLSDRDSTEAQIVISSMHEFWGLWLKMHCKNICEDFLNTKQKLLNALTEAKKNIMQKNSPTANLYHIIKIANRCLTEKDYTQAIKLYTRAIENDKIWSAVAYYNRAYCRILQGHTGYIEKAIDDLNMAKTSFSKYKDETVLSISLVQVANQQRQGKVDISEGTTMSQFQTRCQILSFFDDLVEETLQTLADVQSKKTDAKAFGSSVFTVVLGDDKACKKIDCELYVFYELGLTEIMTVKEKTPFCWKGVLVAVLGFVQIAVGTLIIACSSGILTNFGWALVAEGINDICTGAYAAYNGDPNFVKSWMVGKAASIAISVTTFGFNQVKVACKGVKGIKASVIAVKTHMSSGTSTLLRSVGKIPNKVASNCFPEVFKKTCKQVAIHTGKQLANRGGKYMLQVMDTKIKDYFENETHRSLKTTLEMEMDKGELKDKMQRFIISEIKCGLSNQDIVQRYMEITVHLLSEDNIGQFRQILSGCVNEILCLTKTTMQSEDDALFQQTKPIFSIIESIASQSYNIHSLVKIYGEKVAGALSEIYKDSLDSFQEEEIKTYKTQISTLSAEIVVRTNQQLFTMIQKTFRFTGDSIFADKLNAAVQETISKFADENGLGQVLQNVKLVTKQGLNIAKCVKAVKSGNNLEAIDAAIDITEDGINHFGGEKTKKVANFAIKATRKGKKAFQSGNKHEVFDTVLDIAEDGIDHFGGEKTKKVAKFAIKATRKGKKAFQSGNKHEVFDTALDIAEDGIDHFAGEKTKKVAKFAIKATRKGKKAFQSGNKHEVFDTALDIAEDGINNFGGEKTKKVANFAINATRKGKKAFQSGNKHEVFDTALDIAEDGIDHFGGEKTKRVANFAIKATRKGKKAFQSGNKHEVFDTALDIAEEGIDHFGGEKTKKVANFAIKATRKGKKAFQSGNKHEVFDTALEIAEDGIDHFAGEKTKKVANFAIKATRKGKKAFQSGNKHEVFDTALDIAEDGIDHFAGEKTKKVAKFAIKATRKGKKAFQSGNKHEVFDTALDITEDGIDHFGDEKTKKVANFAIKATRKGKKAFQSGNKHEVFDTVLDIAEDGIDHFGGEKTKKVANFAIKATRKGKKAFQSGNKHEVFDTALDIVEDGIDHFGGEKTKKVANFAIKATKKGKKAFQSGNKHEVFDTALDIAEDGIDHFAGEKTKKVANFAIKATRKGKKALQIGNKHEVFDTALDIAEDGIDHFGGDKTKKVANFAIKATRKGKKAFQSGNKHEVFDTALDIAQDGIDHFAGEKTKKVANFAIKATRKGKKAFQSGNKHEVFDTAVDIAEDGIDHFAGEKTKKVANFAIKATKKGKKAFQSGNKLEVFDTVLDIAEDGIDHFGGEKTKKVANFAIKATRKGKKAFQSGNKHEVFDTALDIAEDGIDHFAGEKTKKVANFAIKATRKGKKAFQSGNKHEVFDTALDITEDGIDHFAGEKTKKVANFAIKATRKGKKAFQSGNKHEVFDTALDIAEDGIDHFAGEKTKKVSNFAIKATRKGKKALQSGNKHEVFDTALDIAEDGIDHFGGEKTKKVANFAIKATRKGKKAFQSGNKQEEGFDAALDITEDGINQFGGE